MTGDLLVADWEQIESAETVNEIYVKRFKAQEVFVTKVGDKFRFPIDEGVLRQPFPRDTTWLDRSRRRTKPKISQESESGENDDSDTECTQGPAGGRKM